MKNELNDKLEDYMKSIASMTDEYLYKFIEKLGGENLRGKDETYIKTYIDTNYKGLTLIREPDCTIYKTYIRWDDKAMHILYSSRNDPTKAYFEKDPKIEII